MKTTKIEARAPGKLAVYGILDYQHVMALLGEGRKLLASQPDTVVDLSAVTYCDSTGIALLVAWMDSCSSNKQNITFTNMPEKMRAILLVSGLEKLLPVKESE